MEESRQKVAVIGTGMAGLVIAYILRNDPRGRFEVEVFEKVHTRNCLLLNATLVPLKVIANLTNSKINFHSIQHPIASQGAVKSQNASIYLCAPSPTVITRA